MRDLNYSLKILCWKYRDGSYGTQANRRKGLNLIADQLHEMGYRCMTARSLRAKHVKALAQRWLDEELALGTLKNRLALVRWWARKVGRHSVVADSNDYYNIPKRVQIPERSLAITVDDETLAKISNPYVRMSVELQRAFGLRREESIKFIPSYADQGDRIRLKDSWTKGGRPREIPVRTAAQRDVLNRARELAGESSLVPAHKSYYQQMCCYDTAINRIGLRRLHGLRHAYAQDRYLELTGWPCPFAGGPYRRDLSPADRARDLEVRLIISAELGHNRESITRIYLGPNRPRRTSTEKPGTADGN